MVPDSDSPPNESVSDQHEYGSHRVKRKEAVMLLTPPSGPPSSDGRFTITIEELLGSPPSSGAKGCRVAEDSGQYTTEPVSHLNRSSSPSLMCIIDAKGGKMRIHIP